jgi:hypothetical protein
MNTNNNFNRNKNILYKNSTNPNSIIYNNNNFNNNLNITNLKTNFNIVNKFRKNNSRKNFSIKNDIKLIKKTKINLKYKNNIDSGIIIKKII